MPARKLVWVSLLALAACSGEPEPAPPVSPAVPLDRPLDAAAGGERVSVRTAALIEAALVQVGAADLRRCLTDFAGDTPPRFAPPAHGGWLIIASALPADGAAFATRNEAAPELNPTPADGWQDRVTYRALLRSVSPTDGSVACLSCVFDYDAARLIYRHAYALDTCQRGSPGERTLATVLALP
jgi:hypothetical protein